MRTVSHVVSKTCLNDNNGFTLIELIVIIAIVSILSTIAVPSFIRYMEMSNTRVCSINCLQLAKIYKIYLEIEKIKHSESILTKLLKEYDDIRPKHGEISYVDGIFTCEIHLNEEQNEGDDEEVPYI